MKYKIFLGILIFSLYFSVKVFSKENSINSFAGISFGNAHLIGFMGEYEQGFLGVNLVAGTWNFENISLNQELRIYFFNDFVRLYSGIGLAEVLVMNVSDKVGYLITGYLPVGIELKIFKNAVLGVGGNFHSVLKIQKPNIDSSFTLNREQMILPVVYYKMKL